MTLHTVHRPLAATAASIALVACLASAPAAQQKTPPPAGAQELASGWSALATGSPKTAIAVADRLLGANPRDHRALALKLEALSPTDSIRALDAYERWFGLTKIEDPFLIEPIARGTLETIAAGTDTALRIDALERLVRARVPGARERLAAVRTDANAAAVEAALVRAGDPDATARLIAHSGKMPPGRGEAVAEALAAAGPAAVPELRRLLADPAGPTRAAAVRALGKLEARDARAEIQARLNDGDPLVRWWAAVALARLGERQGEDLVAEMLASPVADIKLMGAEAYADKGNGPWVSVIMPLLREPGGLTRLRAAELIAPVDPQAARAVLTEAAADPNPVVRAEATRILEEPAVRAAAPSDWPSLRRWLRDPDATVRLRAAGIVIGITTGDR